MLWQDKIYEKCKLEDYFYDLATCQWFDAMRAYRKNPLGDEPERPPRTPEQLGPALRIFQEINDQHTLLRLREARMARGLPQRELAEIIGVSQQAIANFERDGADPKLSTIRAYAQAVGLQITHELTLLADFDPDWEKSEQ